MKFPGSFKVRVTVKGQAPYCATCALHKSTPAATVSFLNKLGVKKGMPVTYEEITDAEYWEYRTSIKEPAAA